MSELIRIVMDGYHDLMINKSGKFSSPLVIITYINCDSS